MKKYLLAFLGLILLINSAVAQEEKELLAQIFEEDREVIDALVLYPKETRLTILETASSPQALIKLKRIQQKTSTEFKALLEQEEKATQQIIWDLTRYPDLVNRLVFEGNKKKKNIEKVLQNYPAIIHERAMEAGQNHYDLLVQIDQLNQSAKGAFETVLNEFSPKVQTGLRELIELPEVLSLLTDNIQLTILVGDLYQKEPDWLIKQSDSLSIEVNRQNEAELQQWQENLENDPEALANLKDASEEFAKENGYDELYYEPETDDDLYYYAEPEEDYERVTTVEHHYYHYPYWYGYPSWYAQPRWRPYPLWWDWGFYFRPNRVAVFIRLPSFHFTNWYFHHPHHHYYYPHLTNHFVRHVNYAPRRYNSPVRVSVNNWRDKNRAVITNDWLTNKNNRVERIREFGRLETARRTYNRDNPNRKIDQKTYLRDNSLRYPNINPKKSNKPIKKSSRKATRTNPPIKSDANRRTDRKTTIKKTDRKTTIKKTDGKTTIQRTDKRKTTIRKTSPKKTDIKRIDRARDYHQRTWNKSKQRITKPKVVPRTSTKRTPTKRTAVKRTTKKTVKRKNN